MRKTGQALLYVLIGIALAAGIVALAALRPDITPSQFRTWFSFSFFTSVLCLVLFKLYWPLRKSGRVLSLLIVFIVVHMGAYIFFLVHVPELPSAWYLLTGPIEVMLFATLAKIFLNVLPPRARL